MNNQQIIESAEALVEGLRQATAGAGLDKDVAEGLAKMDAAIEKLKRAEAKKMEPAGASRTLC